MKKIKKTYIEKLYIKLREEDEEFKRINNEHKRWLKKVEMSDYRHLTKESLDAAPWLENYSAKKVITPAELILRKEEVEELLIAIYKLPKAQRKRVIDKFLKELTITEIAEKEGVAKATVSKSIKQGLKNLRKILDDYPFFVQK